MAFTDRLHNRGSISTGYEIDNSLKFERANGEQIFTSNAAAGNRKTWTFSAWIKRTQLSQDYSTVFSCGYTNIQFMSNDRPRLVLYDGTSYYADPEMLLRDTSAWYHIVVQLDTTQSTASDRVKWWINGDRVTSFSNTTYTNMSQNDEFEIGQAGSGSGNWIRLGEFFGGSEGFGGYMAEVHYLNGTAAQASDFGEYDSDSGIWIPKEYTGGGYGTQGFYYKFDNASNLGEDSSGEGHDANNLNNITSADQATDTPTNNFATLNPIHVYSPAAMPTISHGATRLTTTYAGWWTAAVANMAITSGKWYFEARSATSSTHLSAIGYGDEADIENWGIDTNANRQCHPGRTHSGVASKSFAYIGSDTEGASYGRIFPNGTSPSTRVNYIYTDVIGVAIDADNGYAYWHKNGTYINSGDPTSGSSGTGGYAVPSGTGTNGTLLPSVGAYYHVAVGVIEVNFGGYTEMSISSAASDANGYGTFEYAPPSGYYALCTKNLAEYG